MDNEQERRLFDRFIARFPTKFKDSSEDYGRDVFLRDVSATGACIATREHMFIDDVLSLDVELPDGMEPVNLNGRVRWVKNHAPQVWEVGVEFHKINFMKLHRLVKFSLEAGHAV